MTETMIQTTPLGPPTTPAGELPSIEAFRWWLKPNQDFLATLGLQRRQMYVENSRKWTTRALIRLLAEQTSEEQAVEGTFESNGRGFSAMDAEFLTSVAKQVKSGRELTDKQMAAVQGKGTKKGISRYAAQLRRLAEADRAAATGDEPVAAQAVGMVVTTTVGTCGCGVETWMCSTCRTWRCAHQGLCPLCMETLYLPPTTPPARVRKAESIVTTTMEPLVNGEFEEREIEKSAWVCTGCGLVWSREHQAEQCESRGHVDSFEQGPYGVRYIENGQPVGELTYYTRRAIRRETAGATAPAVS